MCKSKGCKMEGQWKQEYFLSETERILRIQVSEFCCAFSLLTRKWPIFWICVRPVSGFWVISWTHIEHIGEERRWKEYSINGILFFCQALCSMLTLSCTFGIHNSVMSVVCSSFEQSEEAREMKQFYCHTVSKWQNFLLRFDYKG